MSHIHRALAAALVAVFLCLFSPAAYAVVGSKSDSDAAISQILGGGADFKVAAIGDSFVKLGLGGFNSSGGEALFNLNYGEGLNWTNFLCGHPVIYNNKAIAGDTTDAAGKQGQNLGISGDTLDEMRQRLSSATALSNVKYWIVYGGTNDARGDETLTNMQADFNEIVDTLLNQGAVVEINLVTGRTAAAWFDSGGGETLSGDGEPRAAVLRAFNDWLRDVRYPELRAEGKPVTIIDAYNPFLGGSFGDYADVAYLDDDEVHPSTKGAFLRGSLRVILWSPYVDCTNLTRHWVQTQYNASTAPYGNLLNDYQFTGTGGTVTDAEVSGSLATGYTAENISGTHATAVFSKVASSPVDSGTDDWQKMTITSDGAGGVESFRIYSALFGASSPASVDGDLVRAQMQLYMDESSADDCITEVSLRVNQFDTGVNYDVIDMNGTGNPLPNGQLSGLLLTPVAEIQANADRFRKEIYVDVDTSIACTRDLYFGRPNLLFIESTPDYN